MSEHRDRDLREAQLRFIGKILATLSHELKNHLAIIKEYSGLIQDLVEAGKVPTRGPDDLFVSSVGAIHGQIDRTLALLRHFSRFSHRMDSPQAVYDVNEAVEELLALVHRIANQKKIAIDTEFHKGLPAIDGNPALLQFSLFRLLEDAMGRLGKGGSILLKTRLGRDAVAISLVSQGIPLEKGERHELRVDETFHQALRHFGGRSMRTALGEEVTLNIPVATPGKEQLT